VCGSATAALADGSRVGASKQVVETASRVSLILGGVGGRGRSITRAGVGHVLELLTEIAAVWVANRLGIGQAAAGKARIVMAAVGARVHEGGTLGAFLAAADRAARLPRGTAFRTSAFHRNAIPPPDDRRAIPAF